MKRNSTDTTTNFVGGAVRVSGNRETETDDFTTSVKLQSLDQDIATTYFIYLSIDGNFYLGLYPLRNCYFDQTYQTNTTTK